MTSWYQTKQQPIPFEQILDYYCQGYITGWEWMAKGSTFKHPTERGGYFPGGPMIFPRYRGDLFPHRAAAAWLKGFIMGLNVYVSMHNLPYRQIETDTKLL